MIKLYLEKILKLFYNTIFRSKSVFSLNVPISIEIGKGSKIMSGVEIDKSSSIGYHSYIGHHTSITKTNIGSYCSIASNVRIGHGEHDLESFSTSSHFFHKSFLTNRNCTIKNDVWIGTEAVISRGVTIGNGAVIGANSFVNKNIPDYAIAVGSPAKIIKYRFHKQLRDKLINSEWWRNKNVEEVKEFFNSLKKNS